MPQDPEGLPLDHARQVTIDSLCEHFANDVIGVEEFERRVDRAHAARSSEALKELLGDLPSGNLPTRTQEGTRLDRLGGSSTPEDHALILAVLGGGSRKGMWTPARTNRAVAILGGLELDFRDARMPPGVTELQVYAIWGGVEIIVPPGVNVQSHGLALLGGFDHSADVPPADNPDAPTLRITGVALMGGVNITVRLSGETARTARQRRRMERRERRRLGPGS